MNISKKRHILLILGLILLNIGCDQVSKSVARKQIEYRETIPVISDYFILTKTENRGAFLGFLSDTENPIMRSLLLIILPLLVLAFILRMIILDKSLDRYAIIGLSFIIGGGIGNLYDRILYNQVTDFMHIDLGGVFRTGIFNMADVSVMFGTGLLLISFIKRGKFSL